MLTDSENPRKRVLRSLVVIAAIIAGATGIAAWLYAIRVTPPRRDHGAPRPLVETIVVRTETVTEHFVGYGTSLADRSATISAEIAAVVVERVGHIRSGVSVVAGQPLVRLDDREYLHRLNWARALVAADEAAIDQLAVEAAKLEQLIQTAQREVHVAGDERLRLTRLYERELAAENELNVATMAFHQSGRILLDYQRRQAEVAPRKEGLEAARRGHEAEAALAEMNLARCELRAPFSGSIQSLYVDVGDRVAPGSAVALIVDASTVEIPSRHPAAARDRVRLGAACLVDCESRSGIEWPGVVARISPVADAESRTFEAFVRVDNRDQSHPLVPGTFVRATIEGATFEDRILVPRGAIRNGHVFVIKGETARRRIVTTERVLLERAIVSNGVHSGDRVVLSHLDDLVDGALIRFDAANSSSAEAGSASVQTQIGSVP